MSVGRRAVSLHDESAWVWNRMADVYEARPPYPAALVDAIAALAGGAGTRVCDLGAGIGHLALPLTERGLRVTAVEPAREMLRVLLREAAKRGHELQALHARAEELPLAAASFELALIADALHFIDAELCANEVARVLVPGGALAVVTSTPADTPFMRALTGVMQQAAPRRPRDTAGPLAQLAAQARVALDTERVFHDATPVDELQLERILRSISFIGPAMNAERFAAFKARVLAIDAPRVYARTLRLRSGTRAQSSQ